MFTADDSPWTTSLFNLLVTYAFTHPSIGYCQGMSDLAAPLLVVMKDEATAFICLCALMSRMKRNFSPSNDAPMARKFSVLALLIRHYCPKLHGYLVEQGADDLLFSYRWVFLEMKREFPLVDEDCLQVLEAIWAAVPDQYLPISQNEELNLVEPDFRRWTSLLTGDCSDFDIKEEQASTSLQEPSLFDHSKFGTPPRRLISCATAARCSSQQVPDRKGNVLSSSLRQWPIRFSAEHTHHSHQTQPVVALSASEKSVHNLTDISEIRRYKPNRRRMRSTSTATEAKQSIALITKTDEREGKCLHIPIAPLNGEYDGDAEGCSETTPSPEISSTPPPIHRLVCPAGSLQQKQQRPQQHNLPLSPPKHFQVGSSPSNSMSVSSALSDHGVSPYCDDNEELDKDRESDNGDEDTADESCEIATEALSFLSNSPVSASSDMAAALGYLCDSGAPYSASYFSDLVTSEDEDVELPGVHELGDSPFVVFVALTMLMQHRATIFSNRMDYNEIHIFFDKMVRRHSAAAVLPEARHIYNAFITGTRAARSSNSTGRFSFFGGGSQKPRKRHVTEQQTPIYSSAVNVETHRQFSQQQVT